LFNFFYHPFHSDQRMLLLRNIRTQPQHRIIVSSSCRKFFSTVSRRMNATVTTQATPIVELREYDIRPEHGNTYTKATNEKGNLRKSLSPLTFFGMSETGGSLNVATHLYYFAGGFEERTKVRGNMGKNKEFASHLEIVRPYMTHQKSTIFVEAPLVNDIEEVCGLAPTNVEAMLNNMYPEKGNQQHDNSIIEMRKYQLKLGYDTVPQFLKLYGNGLPSKLKASGTDPTTSLVTLLYSEVGQLNEVIEIWRHGSISAMEQSRVAARSATEWRNSIAEIAGLANVFTCSIHKPMEFSPLK